MNAQIVPAQEEEEVEVPPILGSWQNMYVFVLVLHTLLIFTFYLISRAYTL